MLLHKMAAQLQVNARSTSSIQPSPTRRTSCVSRHRSVTARTSAASTNNKELQLETAAVGQQGKQWAQVNRRDLLLLLASTMCVSGDAQAIQGLTAGRIPGGRDA